MKIKSHIWFRAAGLSGLLGLFLFLISFVSLSDSFAQTKESRSRARMISANEFIASEAGQLFQTGDYERALDALEGLLEKYPGDSLIRRYQAICLNRLGRSQEAIKIFEDILTEDPTHIPTHYFLGQAYAQAGERQNAEREWQWVQKEGVGTPYREWAVISLQRGVPSEPPATEGRKVLKWNVLGRYGYEYDSNVTLRPNDDSLASPEDQNAGRQVIDLGIRYRAYSRRDMAVDFHYTMRQTVHDDSLNELNFHSEEFGLQLKKRARWGDQDFVLGIRYDVLIGFLETDLFSVRNRWYLSADTRFTHRTRTIFYNRMTVGNFGPDGSAPETTSRDGFYHDVGVTHYWYTEDFRSYLFGSTEFTGSYTDGKNFDTVGSSSRIGFHHPLLERLALDASLGLQLRFYHNFSSLSPRDTSRRRDINWDLYSGLTYQVTPRLDLVGYYRYLGGENQNDFYDYDRQIGGVQLIYHQSF